jgi:hypothetical protein
MKRLLFSDFERQNFNLVIYYNRVQELHQSKFEKVPRKPSNKAVKYL